MLRGGSWGWEPPPLGEGRFLPALAGGGGCLLRVEERLGRGGPSLGPLLLLLPAPLADGEDGLFGGSGGGGEVVSVLRGETERLAKGGAGFSFEVERPSWGGGGRSLCERGGGGGRPPLECAGGLGRGVLGMGGGGACCSLLARKPPTEILSTLGGASSPLSAACTATEAETFGQSHKGRKKTTTKLNSTYLR